MAERIEHFAVTIPEATLSTAPQDSSLSFNAGIVERLEILIPPGPSGLVGFQVRHSGETVIPHDSSEWIVADDEVIKWDMEGYPTGNAWGLRAYNEDVYEHTLYVRVVVRETRRSNVLRTELVPIAPGATAEDIYSESE